MTDYSTDANSIAEAMNAVYENKQVNKKNSLDGDYSTDNVSYPTCKAVNEQLNGKASSNHTHATSSVTNATAYDNIKAGESTTLTLTDLSKILTALNTKIGELQALNFIVITDNKGTASASTMGKLYIVAENSKVNIYYTERTGTDPNYTYSWHKLDADILDEVTVSWDDITSKPATFTPASHTHGNITNDGKVGTASGKPLITTTDGAVTAGAFGTGSGQFAEGNHTHSGYATDSDIASEISSFASALAEAINPSS